MIVLDNIKRPSNIPTQGRSILKSLFGSRYDGYKIKYNKADIIALLNYVGSRCNEVPDMNFKWGDALLAKASTREAVHDIGVRGSQLKHYNKQAIISSNVVPDENNNCMNTGFIKELCPQKSRPGKNAYFDKCVNIRQQFNAGIIDVLCEVKGIQHRNSYDMHFFIIVMRGTNNSSPNTPTHRVTKRNTTLHNTILD